MVLQPTVSEMIGPELWLPHRRRSLVNGVLPAMRNALLLQHRNFIGGIP